MSYDSDAKEKRSKNLARSLLQDGLPTRKKSGRIQKSAFSPNTSRFSRLIFSRKGSALPCLADDRATLNSRRIWCLSERQAYAWCGIPASLTRQYHLPLACHTLPKNTILAFAGGAPGKTVQTQPSCHRLSAHRLDRVDSQFVSPFEGKSGLTPTGETPPLTHRRKPGLV